jgi:two-component system sensor histidine kinase/response regulator
MAQNQNDHTHAWVLDLPPSVLEKRLALGLIVATAVAFVAVLPVSDHALVEMNALFPSLDAIVLITDVITAVLLFAQFSLSAARPLLICSPH